jgi:RNA polymerase sigma-70 factor (sigma-E family)
MMTGGVLETGAEAAGADALETVFRLHQRSLLKTAYLLLGDRGLAEEAVQEAFLRVHRVMQRAGSPDAVLPYLRTALVNVCRSGVRRLVLARRHPAPSEGRTASPEDTVVLQEEHRAVADALLALPLRQRECLVLRYYLDLSEAEIASTLGISAGSVKTHAHRGMATLAHLLEDS